MAKPNFEFQKRQKEIEKKRKKEEKMQRKLDNKNKPATPDGEEPVVDDQKSEEI